MSGRIAMTAVLLALALAVLPSLAQARDADRRAPRAAVAAALGRAVHHYADPTKLRVTHTLRSEADPAWSLVTGAYGRRGLWAAWTRRTAASSHRVAVFRTRNFDPGGRAPCDIRPAFSEPSCPTASAPR